MDLSVGLVQFYLIGLRDFIVYWLLMESRCLDGRFDGELASISEKWQLLTTLGCIIRED